MNWSVERVRALVQAFAPKRRERVLKVLEERGLDAGVGALLLAQKVQAREDAPPHPPVSDGNLTRIQRDVLEGLRQGFSVNKISGVYGHKKDTIKKVKARFHRKALVPLVPSSTPHEGTRGKGDKGGISVPQCHSFNVEVRLPFESGTAWHARLDRDKVRNYQRLVLRNSVQELFELTPQVSVRVTSERVLLTVKNVWGVAPQDTRDKAWALASGAAAMLQEVYDFNGRIEMRFRGAHWALVDNEVAEKCKAEGVKPVTFVQGKREMWVDDTPQKSLEFSDFNKFSRSYRDEEARVFNGLTNEALSKHMMELTQKMGVVCDAVASLAKVQETQLTLLNTAFGLNKKQEKSAEPLNRVRYIG